jgi:hypothetical protein
VRNFFKNILIALFAYLIVGIIADLIAKWQFNKLPDTEKLKRLNEQKKKYNEGLNRAIKNERLIYIVARSLIAILLLGINYYFFLFFNYEFDLNKQMGINNALILIYSFTAFAIAGTPTKFVKLIRESVYSLNKRWKVGKIDIDELNDKIRMLNEKINKPSHSN